MSVKLPRPPRAANPEDWADWAEQVERQLTLIGSRTLDVGSIAAGTVGIFTITVPGCHVDQGQSVALAAPSTIEASLMWCGVVSADNTVTVRLLNPTGGPIDPGTGTWGARCFV